MSSVYISITGKKVIVSLRLSLPFWTGLKYFREEIFIY